MRFIPPFVLLGVVLSAWEALCRTGVFSPFLVAAPTEVVRALFEEPGEFFWAFAMTGAAALTGFLTSATLGILSSIALVSSSLIYRAFYPYAVVFQTVPIIAVAPLLVIWFGYGFPTVVASAFLASFFPVVMATLTGLKSTSPDLRDLFRLYHARWSVTLRKLVFPMAVPSILTGLRISAGLAVIGAIVGEFVGGGGLGAVVDAARTQQRLDKVFAAVALAAVLGALTILFIDMLNRWVLSRWNPRGHA